jgi:hypothetical protein
MPASDAAPDHVTPYDRFSWSDRTVSDWLAQGERREELLAYFGASEYRVLAALARRVRRRAAADPSLTVIVVPGIMGSQLGLRRPAPLPADILWIDPIDMQHGRLRQLDLAAGTRVVALGAVLFSYLRLKLLLEAQGFAVELYDYDWRQSAGDLGAALAQHLERHRAPRLALVAHSFGGLVARAALGGASLAKVIRVVLIGTPNRGSYAAVQALRGTDAVVRKVARLAPADSAESLAAQVYSSFPSLYELLPPASARLDLLDPGSWPRTGPQPRAALLARTRLTHARLAAGDARFATVSGLGQPTVTAVTRRGEDFLYTLTRAGDGTVPVSSSVLPGAPAFFARAAHSDLTRDPQVAAGVADLLRRGATSRLPRQHRGASRARAQVSDAQLRRTQLDKVDWGALSPDARRLFLQNLNEPPHLKLRAPRRALRRKRAR